MPDWFYRTLSQPILYRLPSRLARSFALGFMGQLSRLPLGPQLIDFLGHMRASSRLKRTFQQISFPSPVGLGPGLDVEWQALPALARFGVGFLSVGPIGRVPPGSPPAVIRNDLLSAIEFPGSEPAIGMEDALPRLKEASRLGVPLVLRLLGEDQLSSVCHLASAIAIPEVSAEAVAWSEGVPLLVRVQADVNTEQCETRVRRGLAAGAVGVLVEGVMSTNLSRLIGKPVREFALDQVRSIRSQAGPNVLIIAGGGVHEPADALALLDAGANLIEIDSGLVFTGPGLIKQVNDAIEYAAVEHEVAAAEPMRPAESSWFWAMLMGVGMLIGSVLALAIASTRVVLPYDEAFVGMTRSQLAQVNSRLLAFMAHDRVTLAGVMIALGIMYVGLSLGGIRRGLHWAQSAVLTSAFTGFASFFLFLGFGYLDPFHAFVTAVLFQFLLLAVHCRLGDSRIDEPALVQMDSRWLRSQWGQLILILHSISGLVAGCTISTVGSTFVFVHEDLMFMQTSAEILIAANPRLVPLIAHDRATFGGMLICFAIVSLLTVLWGFRAGNRWLWWTLLLAGLTAYLPTIAVHIIVGYTDGMHLLPAFFGLGSYLLGLVLCSGHLLRSREQLLQQWQERHAAFSAKKRIAPDAT